MTMLKKTSQIFNPELSVAPLGIIAMDNAKELGDKINNYLVTWARQSGRDIDTFLIPASCPRFQSGDAKGFIYETVRGYDLFFVCDVGNYSCTYPYFGYENRKSPDDHFQDLKRLIQAAGGKARRVNVIMPLLYGGRQHRRNGRESLDAACMLQELQNIGVENVLTFDAHDPRVMNAVPLMGFDNIVPSYQALKALFKAFPDLIIDKEHFMIVSPDEGGMNRNMHYSSELQVTLGMFYKRRDVSQVVDGVNKIEAHEYLGNDVTGMDIFIADDIISSGKSMIEVAYDLKKRNAKRIFTYATYCIFTKGYDEMDKAYADGIIDGVFGTNLTYAPEELLKKEWYHVVDCSKYVSYFITALNHDMSVSSIIDPHEKIQTLLKEHRGK